VFLKQRDDMKSVTILKGPVLTQPLKRVPDPVIMEIRISHFKSQICRAPNHKRQFLN
jgi:hypothetical protein